jgi:hypothetical protein
MVSYSMYTETSRFICVEAIFAPKRSILVEIVNLLFICIAWDTAVWRDQGRQFSCMYMDIITHDTYILWINIQGNNLTFTYHVFNRSSRKWLRSKARRSKEPCRWSNSAWTGSESTWPRLCTVHGINSFILSSARMYSCCCNSIFLKIVKNVLSMCLSGYIGLRTTACPPVLFVTRSTYRKLHIL